MPGIAMDKLGNIGLAYNVGNEETFAGIRYTGRRSGDPLGVMTIEEQIVVNGQSSIEAFGRFGDYSQMGVDPIDGLTFWFTSEYANNNSGANTRIMAFLLDREDFDLGVTAITSPDNGYQLTNQEPVRMTVQNIGKETIDTFTVYYQFNNGTIVEEGIKSTLKTDETYEHIFQSTVDISEQGIFPISAFVTHHEDTNQSNDTLKKQVVNYYSYDVVINDVQFEGLETFLCQDHGLLYVEFTNEGFLLLTEVNISIFENNVKIHEELWTGGLEQFEKESVTLEISGLSSGLNNYTVELSNPNGELDEDITNNMLSTSKEIILNSTDITIQIQTDFFADETTWTLSDEDGIVAMGGPYEGHFQLYERTFCVDETKCYEFVISDSASDGIVNGGYTILNIAGEVLAETINPMFGSQEKNEFCAEFICMMDADIELGFLSTANSSDGTIIIQPTNGVGPFLYSIDGGITYNESNIFMNLEAQEYAISVLGDLQCSFDTTVILEACSLTAMAEVIHASSQAAADGSITINVNNGLPGYTYSIDGGISFQENNKFETLETGHYNVVVKDAGNCFFSFEVEISFDSSIGSDIYGYSINISPNPTEGLINIELQGEITNALVVKYQIINCKGQVVNTNTLSKYDEVFKGTANLRSFPAGMYFIKFEQTKIIGLRRIIKI